MRNLICIVLYVCIHSCTSNDGNFDIVNSELLIGKWQDECLPFQQIPDLSCAFYTFNNDGTYTVENESQILRITDGQWNITNDSTVILDPKEKNLTDSLFFTQIYSMTIRDISSEEINIKWKMFEKDSFEYDRFLTIMDRKFIKIK